MKAVAVFAADLHISDCIWSTHPSIAGDSYYALQQLVDLAILHQCPLCLAGDVLELMRSGAPSSATVHKVSEAIARLKAAGLPLYYICGQHDLAEPSWLSAINPWATDVSLERFEIASRPFYAVGYHESLALDYVLKQVPEDTFGILLHQRWREFEGGSQSHGSLKALIAERPSLRVAVTGDLHQMKIKRYKNTVCISPGATHKRTVAEPNKHYAILMAEDGVIYTQPLKSRPVVEAVVRDESHWERVLARLGEHVAKLTQAAIKSGMPSQIVTPLMVIEDRVRCGAAAEAREVFSGQAHVLTRNSTLEKETVAATSVMHLATEFSSTRDHVALAVEAYANTRFGIHSASKQILLGMLSGVSLEKLRRVYLSGEGCGNSKAD